MRFAAVYHNDGDNRTAALRVIQQAIKEGVDLSEKRINSPSVRTLPNWPDMSTLVNLPLEMQCEYIELKNNKLETIRLLVIDVESTIELDKTPKSE